MQHRAKVVLFGPAHSGKSTLAGYLKYQATPVAAESEILKIRNDLGAQFDEAQALAYLVDKSRDERVRQMHKTQGQSKRLHVSKFQILEQDTATFYVLDTPGAEHISSHRYKGILFSDAGFYCVEARKILDIMEQSNPETHLNSALSYVLSWSMMRPKSPLGIVLTKMDELGWKNQRTSLLYDFTSIARRNFNVSNVVPISIAVRDRTDTNIVKHEHEQLPSLFAAMKNLSESLLSKPETLNSTDAFLFVTSRSHFDEGVGTRMLGKVMSGKVQVRDKVTVYQRDNSTPIQATVKKIIESDDDLSVYELQAGDLGGITVSKAIRNLDNTLLCDNTLQVSMGTVLKVATNSEKLPEIELVRIIGRHLTLLYLGSRIETKVVAYEQGTSDVSQHTEENTRIFTVIPQSGYIWVPFQKDSYRAAKNVASVLMFFDPQDDKNEKTIISGTIVDCGSSVKVEFCDQQFATTVYDAYQRAGASAKFDPNEERTDREGLNYLISLWKPDRPAKLAWPHAPISVAIIS